jgi:hypothetical protein
MIIGVIAQTGGIYLAAIPMISMWSISAAAVGAIGELMRSVFFSTSW